MRRGCIGEDRWSYLTEKKKTLKKINFTKNFLFIKKVNFYPKIR